MTSLTRGPLSPGVYWRRRLAVLGVALLLVIGLARMFGGGGDEPRAENVSAATTATPSTDPLGMPLTPSDAASPSPGATPGSTPGSTPGATAGPSSAATGTTAGPGAPTSTAAPVLPAPTGRCSDDDVVVTPSVTGAQATRTVVVKLTLRTQVTPACTWRASARSLQVKITSGSDRIWSTVDCPRAIPTQDVVVRRDTDATLSVGWSSRRSDEDCSTHTQWAMPGYYHVSVAALGGEPHDAQFRLYRPQPLPKPSPTATPRGGTPTAGSTAGPRDEPTAKPKRHRRVD